MTSNKLKTFLIAGAVTMALSAAAVQAAGTGGTGSGGTGGGVGGPGGTGGGMGGPGETGGGMGGSNTGGGMSGGGNMGKGNMCQGVPSYKDLKAALDLAVTQDTSNLNLGMWATVVNRDGYVCAVAFSGADRNAQWPASRVISAQKANTANSLSLDGLALSTANLYSAVQGTSSVSPLGGSLYGLQFSNPVDPAVAYRGKPTDYGTAKDPMINGRIGGVNVFGGGLGLYNDKDRIIGGVGVSGDTSCRDHMVAWHIRHNLKLDNLKSVGGVAGDPKHPDNMIFSTTGSTTGWEHPDCGPGTTDPATLPAVM